MIKATKSMPIAARFALPMAERQKAVLYILIFSIGIITSSPAFSNTPAEVHSAVTKIGGINALISSMANRTAKTLPQMIDGETETFGVAAFGPTIVYYMRLVNVNKGQIPDVAALRQRIMTSNAPIICLAPIANILISEYGAGYKYTFYAKNRENLFSYTFDQKSCDILLRNK